MPAIFGNPILAGDKLARESITSPDFVEGEQGWTINKDGTAEFSDLTVRGQIIVENINDGIFVYRFE